MASESSAQPRDPRDVAGQEARQPLFLLAIRGNMDVAEPLVFGIGVNKTGTTSLAQVIEDLGLVSQHNWRLGRDLRSLAVMDDFGGMQKLLAKTRANFIVDGPIPEIAEVLAAQFPKAKFICTVRDEKSWLNSWLLHHTNRFVRGLDDHIQLDSNAAKERRTKTIHQAEQLDAAGRDVLFLDVTGGSGEYGQDRLNRLRKFLGLPESAAAGVTWRHAHTGRFKLEQLKECFPGK